MVRILGIFLLALSTLAAPARTQGAARLEGVPPAAAAPQGFSQGLSDAAAGQLTEQNLFGLGLALPTQPTPTTSVLYRVDFYNSAPAAEVVGDTKLELADLAIDPTSGRFYAIDDEGGLYEIDPATAQAFLIGSSGIFNLNALEFDIIGQAWSWNLADGNLYRIDKLTGQATVVGASGFNSGGDLAFDVNGMLYGVSLDDRLIRFDTSSGRGTSVGPLGIDDGFGLEIDATGAMYLGRGSDLDGLAELYRVNKTSGAATLIAAIAGAQGHGLGGLAFDGTAPTEASLFLRDNRFKVDVVWRRNDGSSGLGQPVQLTNDTGYFWFFTNSNVEFVVKVLSGCGLNDRYWVFAGGLTDVRTEILVTDTSTGASRTYINPQGTAFQPLQDTGAFNTCP